MNLPINKNGNKGIKLKQVPRIIQIFAIIRLFHLPRARTGPPKRAPIKAPKVRTV